MVRRRLVAGSLGLALGLAAFAALPGLRPAEAVPDAVASRVKGGQYCNTPYQIDYLNWACGDVCTNNPAATCPKLFHIDQNGPYRAQSVSGDPWQCMDCGGSGYCGGGTNWRAHGCFGPSPTGTGGS
jgi:hypothetical protein